MNREKVVLVNEKDTVIGEMEKLAAHEQGKLHRAFSVFIFNENGFLLLQQRANDKYHGAGLWTNTCCSHPGLNEGVKESAIERLEYEMGIKCELEFLFSFIYRSEVENNLIEHEYDHVYCGVTDMHPYPNALEVQAWKWAKPETILNDLNENPGNYTVWFKKIFERVMLARKKSSGKN
ncbi:MAG: isopentenyl-diphosphate Delta-isomerase [Chitinophagaceae bacterium]|nr:MAG: isopentenyl-diphosphate Delta-isomerase [Chitinophagaceae bacterium]